MHSKIGFLFEIFQKKLGFSSVRANLFVSDSNRLSKDEMIKKGWLDLPVSEIAIAHAAYFIATGYDAFQGEIVRVPTYGSPTFQVSTLCFHNGKGLGGYSPFLVDDDTRSSKVYATCRLK